MINDALTQKRSLLLQTFENNESRFLAARAMQMTDRAIRWITRNPRPLSARYLSVFIFFFSLVPGLITVLFLGEAPGFQVLGGAWLFGVSMSTLGGQSCYYLALFVLHYLKEHLLELQDEKDLDDLQSYMQKLWFPAHPYWQMLVPIVVWTVFGSVGFSYFVDEFVGFGTILGTVVFGFNLGVGFNVIAWLIGLPKHMGCYHYVLNSVDPSSSEVVFRIAAVFNKVMYAYAAFFTLATIGTFIMGHMKYLGIPLLLVFWSILVLQFISTQSALKNIISTTKWRTLNNIQAEIRNLETSGTLTEKETTDTINRLMDLHERIRSTPDSAMNLRTTLNFANQLFLTSLAGIAGILSNLDSILKFLHLR